MKQCFIDSTRWRCSTKGGSKQWKNSCRRTAGPREEESQRTAEGEESRAKRAGRRQRRQRISSVKTAAKKVGQRPPSGFREPSTVGHKRHPGRLLTLCASSKESNAGNATDLATRLKTVCRQVSWPVEVLIVAFSKKNCLYVLIIQLS
jgi:hypothetical protein